VAAVLAALAVRGVEVVLRRERFNDLAHRSRLGGFVDSTGVDTDASGFTALAIQWFIRSIALAVAFDAFGLPAARGAPSQLGRPAGSAQKRDQAKVESTH
jgi:hypothetical protein